MNDLAAALLKDVPRFASPDGNLLAEEDVLAALSRVMQHMRAERDEARGAWEIEAATVKRFADRHERNLVLGAETRARAEAAEAREKRLREALREIDAAVNAEGQTNAERLMRVHLCIRAALTETATTEERHDG